MPEPEAQAAPGGVPPLLLDEKVVIIPTEPANDLPYDRLIDNPAPGYNEHPPSSFHRFRSSMMYLLLVIASYQLALGETLALRWPALFTLTQSIWTYGAISAGLLLLGSLAQGTSPRAAEISAELLLLAGCVTVSMPLYEADLAGKVLFGRVLIGLGVGGTLLVAALAGLAHQRDRAFEMTLTFQAFVTGRMLAYVAGLDTIHSSNDDGWRWATFIGAWPLFGLLWVSLKTPTRALTNLTYETEIHVQPCWTLSHPSTYFWLTFFYFSAVFLFYAGEFLNRNVLERFAQQSTDPASWLLSCLLYYHLAVMGLYLIMFISVSYMRPILIATMGFVGISSAYMFLVMVDARNHENNLAFMSMTAFNTMSNYGGPLVASFIMIPQVAKHLSPSRFVWLTAVMLAVGWLGAVVAAVTMPRFIDAWGYAGVCQLFWGVPLLYGTIAMIIHESPTLRT